MSPLRRGLPPPATAGVRVAADRHFRRPDERPGRRRKPALVRRAVAALVLFLAVVAAGTWAVRRVLSARILTVEQVTISGNSRVAAADIAALVDDLRHESILQVDLDRYRRRLIDMPWIASATLVRVLPRTVEIRITERVPIALARQEELLYLVDDLGTIIDEFGPQYRSFDLPVVDGLFAAGTTVRDGVNQTRMHAATDFLAAVGAAPQFKSRVSEIDVTDPHDVVVILGDNPTMLHVGESQYVDRLRRFVELVAAKPDWLLESVDLRFDGRIIVRPAGRGLGPAAAKQKGR